MRGNDLDLDLWEFYGYTSLADMKSKKYQRLRKAEYDQLNQFEMQFDDQLNGTTTWQDAINEIKARHPK